MRDPQTLAERTKPGKENWLITMGVCTHLRLRPAGRRRGREPRRLTAAISARATDRTTTPRRASAKARRRPTCWCRNMNSRPTPSCRSVEGTIRRMSFAWAKPYEPKSPIMAAGSTSGCRCRGWSTARSAAAIRCRATSIMSGISGSSRVFLVIQIVTGIVLAMHYYASADGAFNSVEHIMRDVNAGWMMRYAHANGASFFFIVVYIHIFRGLYLRHLQGAARAGVDARPRHLPADDGDRLHGLRPAVGPDELLGRAGHHRLLLGLPAGRRADPRLAAGRLCARPGGADPLLLAALSAAVRDRRRGHPPHLVAAHPGVEQPDRGRGQGREGHAAVPSVLHRQGRLVRRRCS